MRGSGGGGRAFQAEELAWAKVQGPKGAMCSSQLGSSKLLSHSPIRCSSSAAVLWRLESQNESAGQGRALSERVPAQHSSPEPGQGCGGLETKFSLGQATAGPAEAQNHLAPCSMWGSHAPMGVSSGTGSWESSSAIS